MRWTTWVVASACCLTLVQPALSQDMEAEIQKYRAQLQGGNPADLWEMKGEQLWKTKRGPKNESLEKCDLGKGAGVVKGAYAELPRYFPDTGRVMDLEARLVHCMQTLQGIDTKIFMNLGVDKVGSGAFEAKGPAADMAALATFVAFQSNGLKFAVDTRQPNVEAARKTGEALFWRRGGPFDFSCATCHSEPNKRIRLQALSDLRTKQGAEQAVTTWPAYRVSQGIVRTLQHRMWDCYWQMRHPDVQYTSDVVTALLTFLAASANGTEIRTPYIKR